MLDVKYEEDEEIKGKDGKTKAVCMVSSYIIKQLLST